MSDYVKLSLFLSMSCSSLSGSFYSYQDLLTQCDMQQVVALREANDVLELEKAVFQPLVGGLTRARLYSFELAKQKYVLRFLALGPSQPLPMRQNEILAHQIGAELNLAPPCLFSDQQAALMIIPFIEGQAFSLAKGANHSHLIQLGTMLQRLHRFEGSYPTRYSFLQRLNKHYQKGLQAGIAYPTGFTQNMQHILSQPSLRPPVPSHGDLNPSNILVDKENIYLIDWTNATKDDPFADLSYFCLLANLTEGEERSFLQAYFGREPSPEEWDILTSEKAKVYLLTATIWLRFSEDAVEQERPLPLRIASLDAELHSATLKTAQDYLQEGIVIDLNHAPKAAIRSYALSFYKAFLDAHSNKTACHK